MESDLMDINTLRVLNVLYHLKINENEFTEIEEEQKCQSHTGLAIVTVKKNIFIGISHDERHIIVIKRLDGKIKSVPKSRIIFKTLTTEWNLPDEIYTLHRIAQYRSLDTEVKYKAESMEELKDRICDRFADKYPKKLGDMYDEIYGVLETREKNSLLKPKLVEEQLKALFWLFNEKYELPKNLDCRENISLILKVFSRNNRRLALLTTNEKWNKSRGCFSGQWTELIERTTFEIVTFTPEQECYNFVCSNREIYFGSDYDENADIWIGDDLQGKISANELKILSSRYDRNWVLLTADEFNKQRSAVRIELMNARKIEHEEKIKNQMSKNILNQFKQGSVTRFGITFTPKYIECNGIRFSGKQIANFLSEQNILIQEEPNFNDILEGYIEFILNLTTIKNYWNNKIERIECRFEGTEKLKVGKINILIEKVNNAFFINEYKIRKEDLKTVILQSIKFSKQKEFNHFVEETSKCNLSIQEILKKGCVSFKIEIESSNDNCLTKNQGTILLSIPVIRREKNNYAIINGKEYRICSMQNFLDIGKEFKIYYHHGNGKLHRTIKLLYKSIVGLSPKIVGELIKNGIKAHKEITKRFEQEKAEKISKSKEFIAQAVKLTQAQRVDKGYLVKGISGTIYFVNENLSVWTVKNGKQDKHLCIVDTDYSTSDFNDEALENDRIAKRLLMLSKDTYVADEVFSRGDKMDNHWTRIESLNKSDEYSEVV
jgi:hypothetical protein